MNKILILNGPPGSGKDTIALALSKAMRAKHLEFKTPLHNIAMAMTGLSPFHYFNIYNNREIKEIPHDALLGFSPRGFLIHISEVMCKPVFGNDYFGQMAADAVENSIDTQTCVFSDGGFPDEVNVLANRFGKENIFLFHIYRQDTNFDNDSRDYVNIEGIDSARVINEFTIEDAATDIIKYIDWTVNAQIRTK